MSCYASGCGLAIGFRSELVPECSRLVGVTAAPVTPESEGVRTPSLIFRAQLIAPQ